MKDLIQYIMPKYGDELEKVKYVGTFEGLRRRYDQERNRQEASPDKAEDDWLVNIGKA